MRAHPFRRVWVWWGRGWAVQVIADLELSLGVRLNWRAPVLDLYLGPLTLAFGRHPEITHPDEARRFSCRGFFVGDRPVL